jgi:type II secretory pathway component PulK
VLILALVCLAIIGVIGGTLLRWALMEHNLLRSREQASQARWLAEAGLERAAAKLAESADYTGETWLVPAGDLPGGQPARVHLHVAPIEQGGRSIEVEVEYPPESPKRAHKQIVYQAGGKA